MLKKTEAVISTRALQTIVQITVLLIAFYPWASSPIAIVSTFWQTPFADWHFLNLIRMLIAVLCLEVLWKAVASHMWHRAVFVFALFTTNTTNAILTASSATPNGLSVDRFITGIVLIGLMVRWLQSTPTHYLMRPVVMNENANVRHAFKPNASIDQVYTCEDAALDVRSSEREVVGTFMPPVDGEISLFVPGDSGRHSVRHTTALENGAFRFELPVREGSKLEVRVGAKLFEIPNIPTVPPRTMKR